MSEDQGRRRLERLDALAARRWALTTRAVFAARRSEIDALNVFPVPDGDTGTNLYLTLDSALDAVRNGGSGAGSGPGGVPDLARDAESLARATLLAARGNSGVILSQLVRGLAEVVGQGADRSGGVDGATLARALRRASDLARASVTRPVEGTILSVATAAAAAAEQAATGPEAAGPPAGLYDVACAALTAARTALDETTAQLPALARAGVVDAGAAGYVLVLESLVHVISGAGSGSHRTADLGALGRPQWSPSVAEPTGGEDEPGGASYEVMFLLADSDPERVARMRGALDELGESLLVVGGPDLWNVHVHVDDVGAALEAGVGAGRPHRIRVTHLAEQRGRRGTEPVTPVAVVACAPGDGLADVFRASGAGVVHSAPGAPGVGGTDPRRDPGRARAVGARAAQRQRHPAGRRGGRACGRGRGGRGARRPVARGGAGRRRACRLRLLAGCRREPAGDEPRRCRHPARCGLRGQPRGGHRRRAVPPR